MTEAVWLFPLHATSTPREPYADDQEIYFGFSFHQLLTLFFLFLL